MLKKLLILLGLVNVYTAFSCENGSKISLEYTGEFDSYVKCDGLAAHIDSVPDKYFYMLVYFAYRVEMDIPEPPIEAEMSERLKYDSLYSDAIRNFFISDRDIIEPVMENNDLFNSDLPSCSLQAPYTDDCDTNDKILEYKIFEYEELISQRSPKYSILGIAVRSEDALTIAEAFGALEPVNRIAIIQESEGEILPILDPHPTKIIGSQIQFEQNKRKYLINGKIF